MKILSALLKGVILFLVMITIGEINPVKAAAANSKASKVVNLDAEKLPKEFAGDNRRIVEILKTSHLQKSEFETEAAHAKRTEAIENKIYVFSYKPRRVAEYGGIMDQELSFDAESNSFSIRLFRFKVIEKSWDDVKGSYTGQNAFGAKARITKGTRNRYFIDLPEETFNFDLQMDPTKANLAAENIRILYWVKLRDVTCRKDSISPTIDNLFDGGYNECACHTIPMEIWIYNFKTGEIFKKVKVEQE